MKKIYIKAAANLMLTGLFLTGLILLVPRVWAYFLPFIIAGILALCVSPVVQFLEKRIRLKRKMGSVVVIVFAIGLIVLLFYFLIMTIVQQLSGWLQALPDLLDAVILQISQIENPLLATGLFSSEKANELLSQLGEQIISLATTFVNSSGSYTVIVVSGVTKSVPLILIGIVVTLLSTYFFVADKNENEILIKKYVPKSIMERWEFFKSIIQHAIGGYFKAQMKIMGWVFLILLIGLFILGVEYALFFAMLIAVLDFFPIIGAGLIMLPWSIYSLLTKDYRLGLGLLIVWALTQLLRHLVQPKYVGESVGLKPMPTLILLYFGFVIGGMGGLILAIPIGYVFISMVKAGAFNTTIESSKILLEGLKKLRKYDK
ncbi:MAG: sporulation integral membrane protein YtvI [Lachnospiraceae bacterium]